MSDEKQQHAMLNELTALRRTLNGQFDPGKALCALDGLQQQLEEVLAEHQGMADALLAAYEQLGVVFEVTRSLPGVREESGMMDIFVSNLRNSFREGKVLTARSVSPAVLAEVGLGAEHAAWLSALLDRVRVTRKVTVDEPPPCEKSLHPRQIMAGAVFAGDEFVTFIVLTPRTAASEFHSSDMLLIESLMLFCGDVVRNLRLAKELGQTSMAMVRALVNTVDQKDPYTSGHSVRVGYYAILLGRDVGWDAKQLQMLEWAALLHDVGKIGIRDDVLKKAGKLTEEEFDHIKEHPVRSHMVVEKIPQLKDALGGVLHHHEKYGGGGYPAGLKGENIPLQARIIQIADIFDALTSSRSYRSAFSWEKALNILQEEAGKTVDPDLQQRFDKLMRKRLEADPDAWTRLVNEATQFGLGIGGDEAKRKCEGQR